ncbi:MAG: ABC transporter permease [Vampirovibrionales bacterium]|nr:ABC transporter permease [Vampirovibrionales bacterium]
MPDAANRPLLFPATRLLFVWLWHVLRKSIITLGGLIDLCVALFKLVSQGELLRGSYMGRSMVQLNRALSPLLMASVLCAFSGMVIALQIAPEMAKQGGGTLVGALVATSLIRELVPVMTGFAMIALAASSMSAELANLNVGNQIDALRVMRINPLAYLVTPRVQGVLVAMPMLAIITLVIGTIGGAIVSDMAAGVSWQIYWESVRAYITFFDLQIFLLKTVVFGILIGLIACKTGLEARGGSEAVGEASTQAVVAAFLAMALADLVISGVFYVNR